MTLSSLFDEAIRRQASDLHLATGEAARLRIDGALVPSDEPEVFDLPSLLLPFFTSDAEIRFASGLPVERTLDHGESTFVGIVFRIGERGMAATFRRLNPEIPPLEVVGEDALPLFRRLMETSRGLILVVGRVGSGKWTTAGSLVDAINAEKASRIFVIESHPSLRFKSRRSLLTSLHVGQDCESYGQGLEIVQQADADVVLLDDLPTLEIFRKALALAETGRLVVANLNAKTSVEAIQRLCESAGEEEPALRRALADNLRAVTGQRLLAGIDGRGRVPVYEWIVATPSVRQALVEGGLERVQAENAECRTAEATARDLYRRGRITMEEVVKVTDPDRSAA